MTMRVRGWLLVVGAMVVAASAGAASGQVKDVTPERIDTAIDAAVKFLVSNIRPDGKFSDNGMYRHTVNFSYPFGGEAICMMALAHADVDLKDPKIHKAFEFLLSADLKHTYTRSCRVIAIARFLPQLGREESEVARRVMSADVQWLLDVQKKTGPDEGMWNYPLLGGPNDTNVDFSNTQFAILAINEFEMAGGELPNEPFVKAMKAFIERVKEDGGWNYGWMHPKFRAEPSYGNMTAVGIASLYIIRDKLFAEVGCPCKNGKSGSRPKKLDDTILGGLKWMAEHYEEENGKTTGGYYEYFHYACARVGLASGLKYFGTHDWYREGAANILGKQRSDGSWSTIDRAQNTCFALMFLCKGRYPILLNKLQFDGLWDTHPRDAANLTKFVSHTKEQHMAWQVINLAAPVAEWHDAPILYICAESPINLTDDEKKKLREYTDTGGTVLFEASCGNRAVMTWWQKTCAEIWPEWELKTVAKDHDLWTADLKIQGRQPVLQGASDGMRTFLFYSSRDLSCTWNTFAFSRDAAAFSLGANLYAYTTDHGKLRAKLAGRVDGLGKKYGEQPVSAANARAMVVAPLKHGGDWTVGQNYRPWQLVAADVKDRLQIELKVAEPVLATEIRADARPDILYLSGRTGCSLEGPAAAGLTSALEAGSFVVAEAVMGDGRFDKTFREAMEAAGLALKPLTADQPMLTGQFGGSQGLKIERVGYSYTLMPDRIGQPQASLVGMYLGDKLVGVYSPFDILFSQTGCKAFGNRGYASEDARALAINLVLQALAAKGK